MTSSRGQALSRELGRTLGRVEAAQIGQGGRGAEAVGGAANGMRKQTQKTSEHKLETGSPASPAVWANVLAPFVFTVTDSLARSDFGVEGPIFAHCFKVQGKHWGQWGNMDSGVTRGCGGRNMRLLADIWENQEAGIEQNTDQNCKH